MKYKQEDVNASFDLYRENVFYNQSDVDRIQSVIYKNFNITLSKVQSIDFWCWRSDEWFAGWLIIGSDEEIIKWFDLWMDYYSRGFKGPLLKEEHARDSQLNIFNGIQ